MLKQAWMMLQASEDRSEDSAGVCCCLEIGLALFAY